MFDAELLEEVTHGCCCVWNDIADDVFQIDGDRIIDAESQIEICMDADRLKTFGYHDAYSAMQLLLETGSFSDLCKAIAKKW